MSWTDQVFAYCERGANPSFWAEPLNAISNAAFFLAALYGLVHWLRRPAPERSPVVLALIGLAAAVAVGSFLFHTTATRWSALADVMAIATFMLVYLIFAIRQMMERSLATTAAATIGFTAAMIGLSALRCEGGACLQGSLGYVPALLATLLIGIETARMRKPEARLLLASSMIFAVSLVLRSLDRAICPQTLVPGIGTIGTHFAWHLLNGIMLALLLRAAVTATRIEPVKAPSGRPAPQGPAGRNGRAGVRR
jgi:hypothetical protein